MNGYQRTLAALRGQRPDRVPVMLHNFMPAAREAGYSMGDYRRDPKKIARSFIQAVETYDYDGVLVEVDTATLAAAAGVCVEYPEDEPARAVGGCLASLEHAQDLPPVNLAAHGPTMVWLEAASLLQVHFGGEIFVRGNCDQAPFSLASMMRGAQQWMMDLLGDPAGCHQLLAYCTEVTIQFVRLMACTGVPMVSNGDSPAGPSMISPAMYEEFALPYERRVVQAAHDCGRLYALHICGNTNAILTRMAQTGADAVELDYKSDAAKAHEVFGQTMTFIGNIDPSGVVARGTAADVKREVDKLLTVFADTPRIILNAGCAIPPTAPRENIRALVQAVRGPVSGGPVKV